MFFYLKVIDYFKKTWIPRMFKQHSLYSVYYYHTVDYIYLTLYDYTVYVS